MKISFIIFLSFLLNTWALAEGSKDLYPSGATGNRAYLLSMDNSKKVYAYPFIDRGAHYVYVNAGEWISMASSTQYIVQANSNMIVLFDPNGNQVTLNKDWPTKTGNIPNRSGELAGPAFPNTAPTGNQYRAIYHQATMSGIYRVEILSNSLTSEKLDRPGSNAAEGEWKQTNASSLVSAWDVSVANSSATAWIKGRVFTYNLDFSIVSGAPGFQSIVYVLTSDGFVYRVKNNGTIGYQFEFTVNNRGFHDPNDESIQLYKSIPEIKTNGWDYINNRYHDPRKPDTPITTTHKIFYNLPDGAMPTKAKGGQAPGDTTWMRPLAQSLSITNTSFVGAEGTPGQMGGYKGGYIHFTSGTKGQFTMKLSPSPTGPSFTPRVLTGMANAGANTIYFDGKDGAGNLLPATSNVGGDIDIGISLHFGEVHFPFFDLEYNKNGFIIERYNSNLTAIESDIVFWDDSDIDRSGPTSPKNANNNVGQSSNSNGHKWSSTFGDESGLDTWSYLDSKDNPTFEINNRVVDLKINSVIPNTTWSQSGDEIEFTTLVGNSGPSDAGISDFRFELPACYSSGTTPPTFDGNGCGTLVTPITYHSATNEYTASVDMPTGCTVAFHISILVDDCGSNTDPEVIASILRNNDVYDVDATNSSVHPSFVSPTNIYNECSGGCNNVLNTSPTYYSPLPITLTKLNANCQAGVVEINWVTASETNVAYFEVQYLRDNTQWSLLERAEAVGNSSTENQYFVSDYHPIGVMYYRLVIVDYDGSRQIINPISVQCEGEEEANQWSVYPVPANDFIVLEIVTNENLRNHLLIYDVAGKLVKSIEVELSAGNNQYYLEIEDLNQGAYFIKMPNTKDLSVLRFVKVD